MSQKEKVKDAQENKKLQDLHKLEHLEEQSKPLWITKQFVERPCIVVIICSIFFIISTSLLITFDLMKQSDQGERDWLTWSADKVIDFDMYEEAKSVLKKQNEDSEVPLRSESINRWMTFFMLECYNDCDNVLDAHNVNVLIKAENNFKSHKNYEKFCLASTQSTDCAPSSHRSFTGLFTDEQRERGVTQAELDEKLDWVLQEENFVNNKFYFGEDFSATNKKTKYLQSIFKFGAPLDIDGKRYKTQYDEEDEQQDHFQDFSEEIIDIAEDMDKQAKNGVNVLVFSRPIFSIMMKTVVDKDFLWISASMTFVWAYLTFHLKSFFLSSFSILNIIMSFPLTLVIFRLILQVTYYSSLHILVIFIVLGIAADDVFVFIDAWTQTLHYDMLKDDLNKRMAVTYRRASRAMLATSSTTACAFFATGFSTIMPISSFGIFAGFLVPMNYLLVITFFPALVILQEKHFKHWCTCKKKQSSEPVQRQSAPDYQQNDDNVANNNNDDEQEEEGSKIEKFFGSSYNDFVFKFRYAILIFFLCWTIGAGVMAGQMGPLTEQDQWMPDSFETQRAQKHVTEDFHRSGNSDQVITVDISWGLSGLNKDDVGTWEADNRGNVEWDEEFSLAPEKNQQFILDTCTQLKSKSFVLDNKVECFMEDFKTYIEAKPVSNTFPVPEAQFHTEFKAFSEDGSQTGGMRYVLKNRIGFIENKLRFVVIQGTAKGETLAPYEEKQVIEEVWEDYEKEIKGKAPVGLQKPIQSSRYWAWMVSQAAFVTNAIQGTCISVAFALVVLLLTTQNIIMALYSILAIVGIVISVLSVMWLNGWEFGVAESITIVILIGFSVDYVVHLANHYVESSYDDRFVRTQESLKEIGVSILSGAVTTLGSGLFLFFAIMSIFNKFAVLIVATISFSVVYALLFFGALLHAFGPQGKTGNLVAWYKSMRKSDKISQNGQQQQQQQQNENRREMEMQNVDEEQDAA